MPKKTKLQRKAGVEYVDINIPRGSQNDDPNLLVSVNGVNYVLPKGKVSIVPDFVAEEIRRSQRAQEIRDRHIDDELDQIAEQAKNLL